MNRASVVEDNKVIPFEPFTAQWRATVDLVLVNKNQCLGQMIS